MTVLRDIEELTGVSADELVAMRTKHGADIMTVVAVLEALRSVKLSPNEETRRSLLAVADYIDIDDAALAGSKGVRTMIECAQRNKSNDLVDCLLMVALARTPATPPNKATQSALRMVAEVTGLRIKKLEQQRAKAAAAHTN